MLFDVVNKHIVILDHRAMLCMRLKDIRLLQQLSLRRHAVRHFWRMPHWPRCTGRGSHQQHRNETRQTVDLQPVLLLN